MKKRVQRYDVVKLVDLSKRFPSGKELGLDKPAPKGVPDLRSKDAEAPRGRKIMTLIRVKESVTRSQALKAVGKAKVQNPSEGESVWKNGVVKMVPAAR